VHNVLLYESGGLSRPNPFYAPYFLHCHGKQEINSFIFMKCGLREEAGHGALNSNNRCCTRQR
jgi:hypothetical protein